MAPARGTTPEPTKAEARRPESVAELERRARKRLPRAVFQALRAGNEAGSTMADNVAAFGELGLIPRVAPGPLPADELTTSVMGRELSLPVLAAPTAVQAVHPDGELAVARATARAGTAMGLSAFASKPIEQVVAANPGTFLQLYWLGGRDRIEQILARARDAGAAGLIVTVDWSFALRRDWGSPAIPERLDARAALAFAPQALARPAWLGSFLRRGALPDLRVPNLAPPGGEAPTFSGAFGGWVSTPLPSWEDLAWLREAWDGRLMVKGVARPDDARRAVEIGADAISVSTHGGNNLDGTPAAIRLLPGVVGAVGGQIEILLDGGVRRGSDVVKALALGARAVMIGRPYLWGLGAGGEAGVADVLEILRAGIGETLVGLGRASIGDLTSTDLVIPEHFLPRGVG